MDLLVEGAVAQALRTGDDEAVRHTVLTAMGLLDRNVAAGGGFLAQEESLQARSLSGDVAGLWEASVAAGRDSFRAVLGLPG
ncbi:hypothetical protein ACIPWI_28680 [Streptomyces sp. NPDC090046]|uniref:hypothetical protein n=1 Tax=Streptomyces sp. NPDC090046 TaxID=3365928 RepID=UPI0037F1B136